MVGITDHPQKMLKKSLHRKNDSEEIDVFEAAKYFSGANEAYPNSSASKFGQKEMRPGARLSLDMPMRNTISSQSVIMKENHQTNKEKKHKQPSSPGGKLANFLNSLFNQTSLKKMKSKPLFSGAKSVKDMDENESPCLRRKRRSSISNFQLLQPKHNTLQSSNSGFRTPPAAFAQTVTPNGSSYYKEFKSYSDHKEISPFSYKNYGNLNPSVISIGVIKGENLKHAKNGFVDFRDCTNNEGSDSDSSSDLFDLPNSDLDLYSSGLPVYETTAIDSLKKSTPISHRG